MTIGSSDVPGICRAVEPGLLAGGALASIFALRGLTLRPIVHNHPPQYQFNPALHLHATLPAPAGDDDFGDETDNVHPLQR